MTLFAIDWGRARIGTAISDRNWSISAPLKTIQNSPAAIGQIAALITTNAVERVIMGIPFSLREKSIKIDWGGFAFFESLKREVRLPFSWVDETMTTSHGNTLLAMTDMTYKKRRDNIDRMAASLILDSFIDRQRYAKKCVVAVTGRIGTGKSTVARYIEKLTQAERIDADAVAKDLTMLGSEGCAAIRDEFGDTYFNDGELDRKKLGHLVFSDRKQLDRLNDILHPLILYSISERIHDSDTFFTVLELPLLFEKKLYYLSDYSLLTTAKIDAILLRATKRDAVSSTYIADIVNNQADPEEVASLSDHVVDTTGGWESGKAGIDHFIKEIYRHYER